MTVDELISDIMAVVKELIARVEVLEAKEA